MTSIDERWNSELKSFIDGLSVVPMPFHGMSGMAVLFGSALASRWSMPLRGLLLAEQPDGTPLGLPLLGKAHVPVTADMAYDESVVSAELPFGWIDGSSAIRIALWCGQGAMVAIPLRMKRTAEDRIAALVAEAMPACGFTDTVRESLDLAAGFRNPPVVDAGDALFRSDPAGDRMRAFARAHPFATLLAWPDARKAAELGEGDPFPGLTPARLSRLDAPGWTPDTLDRGRLMPFKTNWHQEAEGILRFIGAIPLDWIPTDAIGCWHLVQAFRLARAVAVPTGRPLLELVAPCKGEWHAFHERSIPSTQGDLSADAVATFMTDPLMDLGRTLLLPLFKRLGAPLESLDAPGEWLPVHAMAQRLLYGTKALPACVEAGDRWHADQPRIQAGRPNGIPLDHAWDTPFLDWGIDTDEGPYRVIPLDTARALIEEGAPGADANGVPGLDHCVASYVPDARAGRRHILSIRRLLPDGTYVRMATCEVSLARRGRDTQVAVHQTQGRRNGVPSETVARVLDAWLLAPSLKPGAARRAQTPVPAAPRDPIAEVCGFDWRDDAMIARAFETYAFLLPRGLRTLAALEAEIRSEIAAGPNTAPGG